MSEWKFEKHSPIDLTPFKNPAYSVSYDDIRCRASIFRSFIERKLYTAESITVQMKTENGQQCYTASLSSSELWIKIRENRYRIREKKGIRVTKRVFAILAEMAGAREGEVAVGFGTRDESCQLSGKALSDLACIVRDFKTSRLAEILPEDNGNVTVITQYNS